MFYMYTHIIAFHSSGVMKSPRFLLKANAETMILPLIINSHMSWISITFAGV